MERTNSLGGRFQPAPLVVLLALMPSQGCGKGESDSVAGIGGSISGGQNAAGGTFSIGGLPITGGADSGSGGAEPPLEPTADCIHPKVVEKCEGDFCRIEPGCFIMGNPPAMWERTAVDADQVQVTLTHPFWMGRTEVTRGQWKKSGLPVPKLVQLNGSRECTEDDCPQGNATFYEIIAYANRLSEMEGLKPCYDLAGPACTDDPSTDKIVCPPVKITAKNPYGCEGYRLPMEAEWEYAARAGSKTAFPTGEITRQKDAGCYADQALEPLGWYCINSHDYAQRVALKQPNAWGLHDMHGNVTELCNDLYGSYGYLRGPYGFDQGPLVDPTGVMNPPDDFTSSDQTEWRRINRGGAHNFPALDANSSRRASTFDTDSASNFGFRIARTILDGGGGAPP